mgnify:CR=1 FL=1
MLSDAPLAEDEAEDVQRIIRQTEQCRQIIKGLLNFARPSGTERGRLSLAEVARDTVFLMEKPIRVQDVEVVINDRDTGRPRGFGFVTFEDDDTIDWKVETTKNGEALSTFRATFVMD